MTATILLTEEQAAARLLVSPRTLRELSQIMQRDGVPLLWGGCARFERPISGELLRQVYAGGGRMFLFGLESASEAIMHKMAKGTELEHMHRILSESAAAGICASRRPTKRPLRLARTLP